jgi:hypothetical protein
VLILSLLGSLTTQTHITWSYTYTHTHIHTHIQGNKKLTEVDSILRWNVPLDLLPIGKPSQAVAVAAGAGAEAAALVKVDAEESKAA